jgi:hypothetical protein
MECFVVGRALDHALNFIAIRSGLAQNSTEQPSGGTQSACGKSSHGRLKSGHETVAAAVAEEFELVSLIGRMIGVITGELN